MHIRKMITGILTLVLFTIGFATAAQMTDDLTGTQWELITLNGDDVIGDSALTLTFGEDNRASGHAGCNGFGAMYTVDGFEVSFDQIISTMMACADEDVMAQEVAYVSALGTITTYEITADDQLILTGDTGDELVFERITLEDTEWQLMTIAGADVLEDTVITLNLHADGGANGETGCNVFRTSYTFDGETIRFDENIVTTRHACVDEAAAEQEQAYLNALTSASWVTVTRETLTITYGEAGETLVFARMLTLADTEWQLETINGVNVIEGSDVTLAFDAQGNITGSSGCNTFGGTYAVDGEILTFGEIETTERACVEAELNEQEAVYYAALNSVNSYELTDAALILTYGDDDEQLIFTPFEG